MNMYVKYANIDQSNRYLLAAFHSELWLMLALLLGSMFYMHLHLPFLPNFRLFLASNFNKVSFIIFPFFFWLVLIVTSKKEVCLLHRHEDILLCVLHLPFI